MLLERNQALVGLIVVLLLVAGTVYAVFASSGAFRSGMPLTAEFSDGAALAKGDFVFVAGVRSGTVAGVDIDGEVVNVELNLESPPLPNDSAAEIILQNTLGKRAVRIIPGSSSTPFAENDVIPVTRTGTPVDLPQLGDETVELLGKTDVDSLQKLTTALADITDGIGDDLGQLLDGVQQVTDIVASRRTELREVITSAETVIDATADKDQQLVTIIDEFEVTLQTINARRDDIRTLLDNTAGASNIAADLVSERREQIDRVLFELHEDLNIVNGRQVDLSHVLAYGGVSVDGFASIGYQGGAAKGDNPSWGNVFVTNLGGIGVQALFGCGGAMDELLTQLVGPDPTCTADGNAPPSEGGAENGGEPSGAPAGDPDPTPLPSPFVSADGFFAAPGVHLATPPASQEDRR